MTRLEKLEELARAVNSWCATSCPTPGPACCECGTYEDDHGRVGHRDEHGRLVDHAFQAREERCDGANHLEDCPVELALQDVLEASKELQRP